MLCSADECGGSEPEQQSHTGRKKQNNKLRDTERLSRAVDLGDQPCLVVFYPFFMVCM